MVVTGNKAILLSLVVLGVVTGWFASQFTGQDNELTLTKPQQQRIAAGLTKATEAVESESDADEQKSIVEMVDDIVSVDVISAEAELLALIFQDPENVQLTADRIMDYFNLIWQDGDRGVLAEKKVRQFISRSPELNYALLDRLMGTENDQVKSRLESVFMINNSSQRPFLEPNVMDRVKLNEDRSEWLRVLGDWGLQAKSNIAYLLEEMPYFENPVDVGSSIRAISRSSWARSSALPPNDQKKISEIVSAHHGSEYAEVRAASIAALRSFPRPDFQERVIAGLNDPEKIVRTEAWLVYRNNPFPSVEVEQLMSTEEER